MSHPFWKPECGGQMAMLNFIGLNIVHYYFILIFMTFVKWLSKSSTGWHTSESQKLGWRTGNVVGNVVDEPENRIIWTVAYLTLVVSSLAFLYSDTYVRKNRKHALNHWHFRRTGRQISILGARRPRRYNAAPGGAVWAGTRRRGVPHLRQILLLSWPPGQPRRRNYSGSSDCNEDSKVGKNMYI